MPCSRARARELLREGKAAVFRCYPFTIILKEREEGNHQSVECKIDPGSKTTGVALVGSFRSGEKALFAAHLHHRGKDVKIQILTRRASRRSRRSRTTRYRAARFDNRKKEGIAPSLQSRLNNTLNFVKRLEQLVPLEKIVVETVCFDMQKMQNPEISGMEYTRGTLAGWETRAYLLQKYNYSCVYCGAKEVPLEIEHVVPVSRGGSHRINNLVISCISCNRAKGSQSIAHFVKDPFRLQAITQQLDCSLAPAAHVNTLRKQLVHSLTALHLPITESTGAMTRWNRSCQGYQKDHWIDAVCCGPSGASVFIPKKTIPLEIYAKGRGSRQMCRVDTYGFPRTTAKKAKRIHNFQTGDIVKASVPNGTKKGCYTGRIAIRTSGFFNIHTENGLIQGIHARYCHLYQRADGYDYKQGKGMDLAIPKPYTTLTSRGAPSSDSTRLSVSGVVF